MKRLVASVSLALVLAAGSVAPAAAQATTPCRSSEGVTVVVDFGSLGGGVEQHCEEAGAGIDAARLFESNGFPLTYVQRHPAFVCRVSGVPADDPCVNTPPTDAYWGLWWADGESPEWRYSTTSAGSLAVSGGASVALAWNDRLPESPPGVPAPVHAAGSAASPTTVPDEPPDGETTQGDRAALPRWVAPAALAALLAAAGGVLLLRRRRST
jgi:hypothetical protein